MMRRFKQSHPVSLMALVSLAVLAHCSDNKKSNPPNGANANPTTSPTPYIQPPAASIPPQQNCLPTAPIGGVPLPSPTGSLFLVSDVSYQVNIQPIIQRSCLNCHSSGQYPLGTYANLQALGFARVVNAVQSGSMPKNGGVLPAADKQAFIDWSQAPNNFKETPSSVPGTVPGIVPGITPPPAYVNCPSPSPLVVSTLRDQALRPSDLVAQCGNKLIVNWANKFRGCHIATATPSWCNDAGVANRFAQMGAGPLFAQRLAQIQARGFTQVYQCGEVTKGSQVLPTVMYMKVNRDDASGFAADFEEICANGACVPSR